MTDDRVAGLPDAGTIQPGDPGHIETHDRMAELMQFAAERIGIILDPPAPKPAVIGEYGHVDAHNTLLANIEQIAREAGTAVGGPPAPVLTNPEGGSVVAFTSGGEGAGGPTIAYGAEIEPNDNGETVTVEWDDPLVGGEVAVTGTQPFTDYIVTVYGVNVAGRGESATTDAFQLNYNRAEGGTPQTGNTDPQYPGADIVDDYNGTKQKWAVHTFVDSGDFVVHSSNQPFRALLIGGGGAAASPNGNPAAGYTGGGGGSGGVLEFDDLEIDAETHPVSVGNGGQGTLSDDGNGYRGATGSKSTFFGLEVKGGGGGGNGPRAGGGNTWNPGGGAGGSGGGGGWSDGASGGGAGTLGQGTSGTAGANGMAGAGGGAGDGTSTAYSAAGRVSTITGTSVTYAQRYGAIGGGGAGPSHAAQMSQSGKKGRVIIAYQIGSSTSREVAQAKADRAAREAGYATGYDVGVNDGREQRDEEIRAAAEEVKEAVKEALPTKDKKK